MKNLTKEEIAAIFSEWETRERANPDAFIPKGELSIEEHGKRSADFFCELLKELRDCK